MCTKLLVLINAIYIFVVDKIFMRYKGLKICFYFKLFQSISDIDMIYNKVLYLNVFYDFIIDFFT